jgi:hypothetical protein
MKGIINRKQILVPTLAVLVLFAVSLACGSEASPTKIGEITSQEASTSEAVSTEIEQQLDKEGEIEAQVPTQITETSGPMIYEIGDVISIEDMILVVLGWDSPESETFTKPDEGNKFIGVELLLVNQGDEAETISTLLQMYLKDETGQKYDVDLMAAMAIGSSSPDGEISPGERLRGKVGFQVPADLRGLQFVFDADIFGTGKVFVNLGPEPISIEPPTELQGETAQTTYEINEIIEINDLVMVVLGWDSPEGDSFNTPDEGNKFVLVDVVFVNRGDDPMNLSSLLQMELKDDTGQSYDQDLGATMAADVSSPDGLILPGERIRGKIGFQVPAIISGLVFVFDADVIGAGKVLVNLGLEPVLFEAPSELPGETEQEKYALGDVIEVGDLTLTINEVTYPTGDSFNLPKEGNQFIVIDLTIENKGSEAKSVSTMLQMGLKDATGQLYDIDISATMASGGSTPDGEIAPGEKLRGQIGFQVPEGVSGLVFVLDLEIFDQRKLFVALP